MTGIGADVGEAACCRRAFTLLEMVVAVAVFALVVGILFTFSREVTRSWQRLHREQTEFSELMALDRVLDTMLSNAIPFVWPDAEGEPVPFFEGGTEGFRLATLHRLNREEDGAIRFVEVFVQEGMLAARHAQRPYRDWAEVVTEGQESILARDVERLTCLYADWAADDTGEWGDRLLWLSEWSPDRPELPLAIMMTVTWRDGRTESWLRRTAGQGWRERFGRWQPAAEEEG